jgi:hypothetical protein
MVVSKFLADERGTYADWRPLTCALLTLLPASGVRRTWRRLSTARAFSSLLAGNA